MSGYMFDLRVGAGGLRLVDITIRVMRLHEARARVVSAIGLGDDECAAALADLVEAERDLLHAVADEAGSHDLRAAAVEAILVHRASSIGVVVDPPGGGEPARITVVGPEVP